MRPVHTPAPPSRLPGPPSRLPPPPRLQLAQKFTLAMTLLVGITAGVQGLLLYRAASNALVDRGRAALRQRTVNTASHLGPAFEALRRNVLALARTPPIDGIIQTEARGGRFENSTTEDWQRRLGVIFTGQLSANPDYTQVRYIRMDGNGREIVRVQRVKGRPHVVPQSLLQSKGHRNYLQEALMLQEGEVYLSNLELNREQGRVVLPAEPTLRAATPIYSDAGLLFGVVVINVDASIWLQRLATLGSSDERVPSRTYVTNSSGDYVLHPTPSKAFGFERGQSFRLNNDVPELQSLYQSASFTATQASVGDSIYYATRVAFDRRAPERFLVVAHSTSKAALLAGTTGMGRVSLLITIAMIALTVVLVHYLSRPLVRVLNLARSVATSGGTDALESLEKQTGEFEIFARAFRVMHHAVQERERSLSAQKLTTEGVLQAIGGAVFSGDGNFSLRPQNESARRLLEQFPDALLEDFFLRCGLFSETNDVAPPSAFAPSGNSYSKEIWLPWGLGQKVPFLVTRTELQLGRDGKWLFLLSDLSDLKQAAQARRDFVSVVSHELRTPLTSIRGSLGLLLGTALGPLPPTAAELLVVADRNCERLLQLVSDILDFEAMARGHAELNLETLSVDELLAEAEECNTPYAHRADVQLIVMAQQPCPAVRVDPRAFAQIMSNLISNAVKFSTPKSQVRIGCRSTGDQVSFFVSDTGCGIPEEAQPRIFEAFVQADNTSKRRHQGTGLGLAIVRQQVERLGGTVQLSSRVGEGTTFTVNLKAAPGVTRPLPQAATARAS